MECMKEWVVGAYKHDSCYFTEAQTCQNMECWPWKEKKREKNHKKGIVSWLIKKKNLRKKWKIIYFLKLRTLKFSSNALSWFKSSCNFQASYRMYQIVSRIFCNYEYTNFSITWVCLLVTCSWHVFTNSESTKLRIFFTIFFLFSS